MSSQVLVAGLGNIFLSDDGFGPEVVRHLASAAEPALPDGVQLVDYGIRGMHLAYDLLNGFDALVLIDALPGPGAAGEVRVLEVSADDLSQHTGFDSHSMDPVAVLSSLSGLGGELPLTYVVGAQPVDLSEGIGLSAPMAGAVAQAATVVRSLLADMFSATPSLVDGRTE